MFVLLGSLVGIITLVLDGDFYTPEHPKTMLPVIIGAISFPVNGICILVNLLIYRLNTSRNENSAQVGSGV